ncbi:MAG: hypothetical protein ACF8XB_15930 [Planctomycetota bacterium JB042]
MSMIAWMNELVGKTVLVETDDDELTGPLDAVTEEPMVALRLEHALNIEDEEFGTTIVAWKPGYRISVVDDDDDDDDVD